MISKKNLFLLCALNTAIACSAASDYSGAYLDPNHPNCNRIIIIDNSDNNSKANIYGADAAEGKNIPCDGITDKKWGPIPAVINGIFIVVDLSSKGGPSNLHGRYNAVDGKIEWEDGNYWIKKRTSLTKVTVSKSIT